MGKKIDDMYGTMEALIHINGPTGVRLADLVGHGSKPDHSGLMVKQGDETDEFLGFVQILRPTETTIYSYLPDDTVDDLAAAYLDVKERLMVIQSGFDGASPPDDVLGYHICHTAGGVFLAGKVYWCDGTNVITIASLVPVYEGIAIATPSTFIGGSLNMEAESLYVSTDGDVSWKIIGGTTGAEQWIKIPVLLVNVASVNKVPLGAKVMDASLEVTTAYSAAATISAAVGAVTVLGAGYNYPQYAARYQQSAFVDTAALAVVQVTVGGAPAAGAAELCVGYVDTFLV